MRGLNAGARRGRLADFVRARLADAAILAGSLLLWQALIWIAWGLWAVTR